MVMQIKLIVVVVVVASVTVNSISLKQTEGRFRITFTANGEIPII